MAKNITVNLKHDSYDIKIKKGIINNLGDELKLIYPGKKIFIITDKNVNRYYGENIKKSLNDAGFITDGLVLPAGEAVKSHDTLVVIYKQMLDFKLNRGELVIILGGGVMGDLGGFAAATFLRGINYIQIPTSLIAQTDSAIGGKVAINLPWGKNLIGSIFQPKAVYIDTELLNTLPEENFTDGMAEVIKYGCIKDSDLFKKLMSYKDYKDVKDNIEEIVYTCCDIKKNIVKADEKDFGERMKLNFGHTYGHAIEKYYNFEKYSHGQAVAIGMSYITNISERIGITQKGACQQLTDILRKYKLPINIEKEDNKDILKSIELDKKNINNSLKIILLKNIGESIIYDTSSSFFEQ